MAVQALQVGRALELLDFSTILAVRLVKKLSR